MIDRYLLRYFLAVVDTGTFTRAAQQVNVAQPTLSVGIAKLERLLGARLFHRTSQRIELTEAGTRLAAHARRIESEFLRAEAAVTGLAPTRVARIGVLGTVATATLGAIVRKLAAALPDLRIEIVEGNERNLLQSLARGRVDLALTLLRDDAERFAAEPCGEEGYALALPVTHPLAGEAEIAAEALADSVMIVRRHCEMLSETSRHFTERGVRPFFALRTTNDDRALAMVRDGLGVTVMPEGHRVAGVVRPRLAGFGARRRVGLLWADHAEALRHDLPALGETIRDASRVDLAPARD